MTDYVKREDVLLLIREESSAWKGKGDDVAGALNALECVADSVRSIPEAPVSEEQETLWDKYHIETDESFTECIERTIDGWKQRALKAERAL